MWQQNYFFWIFFNKKQYFLLHFASSKEKYTFCTALLQIFPSEVNPNSPVQPIVNPSELL